MGFGVVTENKNKFLDEQFGQLKNRLETKTNFHIAIKGKKNGAGEVIIKFNNEAEFNDIFKYMMTSR